MATTKVNRKNRARLRGIAIDLSHHRVEIVELQLVAELAHELDLDATAVQVPIEVEQMCLEQGFAAAVDGRARAQAGDAR